MHEAKRIANEFIQRALEAGHYLTPMQVQKLVYFAHARMLALHGTALVRQEFQAWQYGPVVPEIYDGLQRYGRSWVREAIPMVEEKCLSTRERDIVDWTYDRYSPLSAWVLSELSHAPGGPWAQAKVGSRGRSPISNQAIADYHAQAWQTEILELVTGLSKLPKFVEEYEEAMGQLERGEYHTSASPDEMLRQIATRAETSA